MVHQAIQNRKTLFFTLTFAVVFLLILPLQARATKNESVIPPANQEDVAKQIQSDETGVTFEVSPPEFEQTPIDTERGVYNQIRIPGFDYTGIVGQPDLPQKGFLVALPPGAVPELEIISAENYLITGSRVAPTVKNTLLNNNYDDFTSPDYMPDFEASYPFDETVYNEDANYPASPVSLGEETTLRRQRVVWVIVNPIQVNPVQETMTVYNQLKIQVRFAFPNGRPTVETLEPETGAYAEILQNNLLNYEESLNWRVRPSESAVMPETSPCMNPNGFRIELTQTGMYAISYADLSTAHPGFPSSVPANKIRMCYENQEIRIKVNDGGDGNFNSGDSLIFYGESIKTQETETNIYWLTYSISGVNGIRMNPGVVSGAGTAPAHYIPTYHLETDAKYLSSIPMADLNDHWYWGEPVVAQPGQNQLDINFQMSNKASGVYNFIIRFELWGYFVDELHIFEVKLNGTSLGTDQFTGDGDTSYLYEGNAPSSALINGTNTVSIIAIDTDGNPNNTGHKFLVNWMEVEPRRQFVAQNNRLAFGVETADTYSFSAGGLTSGATVEFFDVTNPFNPTIESKTAAGGSVTFNRTVSGPANYELYATTAYLSPDAVIKDSIDSGQLGTPNNTADYIIITTPALDSALNQLRTLRSSQGLAVKTVFVQDIFDEFSYGRYATYGIHDFLEYAYNNWNGDLDYVLLAGDGTYDHRDVLGTSGNSNQVPVYLRSGIDSLLGEAAADNQYVDFNGDDLADMMLGRLPAQTTSELSNMVGKILAYESAQDNPTWRGRHFFVVDNAYIPNASPPPTCIEDPAGDFFATVNNFIASHFPENQLLARLYYAPSACFPDNSGPYDVIEPYYATSIPDMQQRLIAQYNLGNQFVIYTGHSATQNWGGENYFNLTSVSNLNNGSRTPIMLPMTCLEGWYHFSGPTNGLSEAQIKRTGGGAVASYSPTGFQVQHGHDLLITGFYEGIFDKNGQTLGEAVLQAKINLDSGSAAYQDLHDTFMTLGDPAMQFNIPSISQTFLPVSLR